MKSKLSVLSTSLLLALGLFSMTSNAATYKIATISPDGLSWMKKLRTGVKTIDEKTEGRVKFKIYPGGVQGNDATVLKKMRIGQLHGGAVAAGSLTRFYPDLQVYNLPLQFRSYQEVDHIREQMDQMIADGLEEAGMVTFALTETGFAYLLTQTPVESIDQLKDLKAWLPNGDPIAEELIKSFDVSPIPLNLTDVLAGLQTGLVNAVVAPPSVALALQWHNHVKYVTQLPLLYIYSMLAMDKKAFNRIKPEDQKIVREVMDELFLQVESDNRVDNEKALKALETIGIQSVEVTQPERWQAVADQSVESLIQSGEISPEMVRLYLKKLNQYRDDTVSAQ
jgi:TRAP-type C4-dicarboxylate transport system substrate-binding protein